MKYKLRRLRQQLHPRGDKYEWPLGIDDRYEFMKQIATEEEILQHLSVLGIEPVVTDIAAEAEAVELPQANGGPGPSAQPTVSASPASIRLANLRMRVQARGERRVA